MITRAVPRAAALFAVVVTACSVACGPKAAPATPPTDTRTRAQIEAALRAHLATIEDPCARATWIRRHAAEANGLEHEVAEPIAREHAARCADAVAEHLATRTSTATAPTDTPVVTNIVLAPPCTRMRADTELRRHPETPRPITTAMIEAVLGPCITERIATCQRSLAESLDAAITCWDSQPWTDVPASLAPETLAHTSACLRELKGVAADLATCPELAPASRASCVSPYLTYTPSCAPLDVTATWKALPGHDALDQVLAEAAQREAARTQADRDREAKRLAAIAEETERCHGHTTLDVAVSLKANAKLAPPRTCRYQVFGKVVDHNNVFVQLVDPISAGSPHLLRTREAFSAGAVVTDRMAAFAGTDEAEMADGGKRVLAVFELAPAKH